MQVMIIAAVCPPDLDNDNDGLIFIERISRTKQRQRISRNQNFSNTYWIDKQLKANTEGWRQFFVPDTNMTVDDLADTLSQQFDLDETIVQRLVVGYTHYEPDRQNGGFVGKKTYLDGNSDLDKTLGKTFRPTEDRGERELTLEDLQLFVEYKKGDDLVEDISCDSEYMLDVLPRMAKAMRKKFDYLPPNTVLYLQMDNAGGHGTNKAKETYTDLLKDKYNIEIIWQPPRSPETNLLDLGVWMSLQSRTEKLAYELKNTREAIWEAAYNAFLLMKPEKLTNVVNRLKLVYHLVDDDDGDNTNVESQRGKLTTDPNPPEGSSCPPS